MIIYKNANQELSIKQTQELNCFLKKILVYFRFILV